ncbi:MAG: phosphonopyruvate decarboxylase [Herbinix sp.]|jgi:phosphonopyruvate decarboxylase|nr:phosphonopyruvate decarboxylase [Herbinix sp.]
MVNVKGLYEFLNEKDIQFFAGVPDSQLKPFCDYLSVRLGIGKEHIIAANEGNAVALAAGYHLATGKIGMVYLQNSGLGNAVNPITSLTDAEVYAIPVVYMIGWRGQPGVKDEPQHVKQGKITLELLQLMGIKYQIVDKDSTIEDIRKVYNSTFEDELKNGRSVAFVVEKNALDNENTCKEQNTFELSREEAIQIIIDHLGKKDVVISTTGKASRELFEYREKKAQGHEKDFLTVGSMGHASMIATAIAENTDKSVWCIDGDGAMLMHTGAAALIGSRKPKNLYHILINNGAHETVGGMPTISYSIDWGKATKAFGYMGEYQVKCALELSETISRVRAQEGPIFIEVLVNLNSRDDLGRPTIKPVDNKKDIMTFIRN